MSDVECPYCGAEQEICHDDNYGLEEGVLYHQECSECEKMFVYDTHIIILHEAYSAPCLNDGNHRWEETHTLPRCFRKLECSVCGETKEIEGIQAEIDAYFAKIRKNK